MKQSNSSSASYKIITIIGARPQFIKAAMVSRAIKEFQQTYKEIQEIIIHTGQHFDKEMSEIFFDELDLQAPMYNLNISSLSHGAMTGRMLESIEEILLKENPNLVIVYGDTNSTLAGALASAKLKIPLVHVEAGLRSYNMSIPEEINRVLTDRISNQLYCPTETAVNNLTKEGINRGVFQVGDVMYDASKYFSDFAINKYNLNYFNLKNEDKFLLCTIHREANTNNLQNLTSIFEALQIIASDINVILPIHPRTRKTIESNNLSKYTKGLTIIPPASYLELQFLQLQSLAVITDSGGVQKEAFFHKKPCLTLRDETEWTETVSLGCNVVVGTEKKNILEAWQNIDKMSPDFEKKPYGDGTAAKKILEKIVGLI